MTELIDKMSKYPFETVTQGAWPKFQDFCFRMDDLPTFTDFFMIRIVFISKFYNSDAEQSILRLKI